MASSGACRRSYIQYTVVSPTAPPLVKEACFPLAVYESVLLFACRVRETGACFGSLFMKLACCLPLLTGTHEGYWSIFINYDTKRSFRLRPEWYFLLLTGLRGYPVSRGTPRDSDVCKNHEESSAWF